MKIKVWQWPSSWTPSQSFSLRAERRLPVRLQDSPFRLLGPALLSKSNCAQEQQARCFPIPKIVCVCVCVCVFVCVYVCRYVKVSAVTHLGKKKTLDPPCSDLPMTAVHPTWVLGKEGMCSARVRCIPRNLKSKSSPHNSSWTISPACW